MQANNLYLSQTRGTEAKLINWDVKEGDVAPEINQYFANLGYSIFGGVSGGSYQSGILGDGRWRS